MIEALKSLSEFFTENNLRSRRNLRGDIEKRSLAINEDFVKSFGAVKEVNIWKIISIFQHRWQVWLKMKCSLFLLLICLIPANWQHLQRCLWDEQVLSRYDAAPSGNFNLKKLFEFCPFIMFVGTIVKVPVHYSNFPERKRANSRFDWPNYQAPKRKVYLYIISSIPRICML